VIKVVIGNQLKSKLQSGSREFKRFARLYHRARYRGYVNSKVDKASPQLSQPIINCVSVCFARPSAFNCAVNCFASQLSPTDLRQSMLTKLTQLQTHLNIGRVQNTSCHNFFPLFLFLFQKIRKISQGCTLNMVGEPVSMIV
jgi:hypothetical protein